MSGRVAITSSEPTAIGAVLVGTELLFRVAGESDGASGSFGRGLPACSQASHNGLWMRPAQGVGSLELEGGRVSLLGVGQTETCLLGHSI